MPQAIQPLVMQIKVTGQAQAKAQIASVLGASGGGSGASSASSGGGFGLPIGRIAALFVIRRAIEGIVEGFLNIIKSAESMSQSILNIKDTLGASFSQASGMSSLFTTAGMSGEQGSKLAERLAKDVTTPQARAAMNILGVGVNSGQSGADNFYDVIGKLRGITDGTRKASLAMQIFGDEGYKELLPILRMSQNIYDETKKLGQAWSPQYTAAITEFQQQLSLLGQAFMVDLIIPLATDLIPTLVAGMQILTQFLDKLKEIGSAFSNMPGFSKMLKDFSPILGPILGPIGQAFAGGLDFWKNYGSKIEDNTRRAADALMDIKGNIIGGGGPLGNRAIGSIEAEYAIRNSLRLA